MKKSTLLILVSVTMSTAALASPLINSWMGSGMDADKRFCEYGDGQVIVVSGSQNCPMSN